MRTSAARIRKLLWVLTSNVNTAFNDELIVPCDGNMDGLRITSRRSILNIDKLTTTTHHQFKLIFIVKRIKCVYCVQLLMTLHLRATGCHLSYEITTDTSEHTLP